MKRTLFVAFLATAATVVTTASGQETVNCQTGLLDSIVQCFVSRSLPLTYLPGVETDPYAVASALSITLLDPLVQCSQPDAYKEAAACFLELLETCSDPPNMVNRLPSLDFMERGMDAMCGEFKEANAICYKEYYNRLQACTVDTLRQVMQAVSQLSTASAELLTCIAADVSYDCTNLLLGENCDALTRKAYLKMVGEFFIPRVCATPELRPARSDRKIYVKQINQTDTNTATSTQTTSTPLPLLFAAVLIASQWGRGCLGCLGEILAGGGGGGGSGGGGGGQW